ncbi:MAG TPA: helix-turn-helix domain-containing protein [Abditibacterium sp.]
MKQSTDRIVAPREPRTAAKPVSSAPPPRRASKAAPAPEESSDAKKRVRLKPESREQLLERLRNPELSLHEASILLRVSRATVRRYADAGRLTCQRTPGGQRRFFLRDIEMFYRQLKLKK